MPWTQAPRNTSARRDAFEHLEQRIVLSPVPFPDLADMLDPLNTVVRFETTHGVVDLEMYDVNGPGGSAAPNTVANFLNYVRRGDYDLSFFHRLVPGFVLQGGGFAWEDDTGLREIPTDDPINNEFNENRSNIERTLAMARIGGQPNSATSQFFINLDDDNEFLDEVDGGFTVFGRVLDQRSWDVVLDIAALDVANFATTHFALGEVPVADPFTAGDPISSDILVNLVDVEIIKHPDTDVFFAHVMAFPEGYGGPTVIQTITLANPSASVDAEYQIIVRYETGPRDTVIASGTIEAQEHLSIPVTDFNTPGQSLVRWHTPYAIEVRSTLGLGGGFNHHDFGATVGEAMFTVRDNNGFVMEESDLTAWTFGGTGVIDTQMIGQDISRLPFLLYQNLTGETTTVTITFAPQNPAADIVQIQKTLDPYRRGGIEIFSIPNIPNHLTAITVESDNPIVASLTVYESSEAAPEFAFAYASLGTAGGGLTHGALAAARIDPDSRSFLTVLNNSANTGAVVTFRFILNDGSVISHPRVMQPGERTQVNLRANTIAPALPEGEFFTINYTSNVPLTVTYISELDNDTVATPFSTIASPFWLFADGTIDPDAAGENEFISIYNPHRTESVDVRLQFYFSDPAQSIVAPSLPTIGPGERLDVSIRDIQTVLNKIGQDPAFRTYSFSLLAVVNGNPPPVPPQTAPIVAQMSRTDSAGSNSITSLGTFFGGLVWLNDPELLGGTGG